MHISIINGSPKAGASTSGLLVEYLTPLLAQHSITAYRLRPSAPAEDQMSQILSSDILIFAFPLYVDSIPAHLLRFLLELEHRAFISPKQYVYCMVNNGFFEGRQNHIAIAQMKHWCRTAGLTWGQALGIGAGEMLPLVKDIPLGHGPNKNLGNALHQFARNINSLATGEDLYFSPNWPRLLWRIQSSLYVWYPRARANGLSPKDISAISSPASDAPQ